MINNDYFNRFIKKENLEIILETIYLCSFILFISYFFLNTTTFQIIWSDNFYVNVRTMMIVLTLIRVGYSKKYSFEETVLVFVIGMVFLSAWYRNNYLELFDILIVILGAKGISFQKLLKVYFIVSSFLLLYTIGASLIGHIENWVYYDEGRRARNSFGIVYPTDFSAHVFYILLSYVYLRKGKLKYIELGIIFLAGCFVYWFCDARLNTICIIGMAAVFLLYKICEQKQVRNKFFIEGDFLSGCLALSTLICCIVMTGLSLIYSHDNALSVWMDGVLNRRLQFGKKGIDIYGFSLWGKYIPQRGMGGVRGKVEFYYFLDSSYLSIALKYGLMVLGAILLIWLCIGLKAKRDQDIVLLLVLAIISVQCMVEHHMIEVAYNPFLMALFATLERNCDVEVNGLYKLNCEKRRKAI